LFSSIKNKEINIFTSENAYIYLDKLNKPNTCKTNLGEKTKYTTKAKGRGNMFLQHKIKTFQKFPELLSIIEYGNKKI
jgi:hypothetical protein